MERVGRQVNDLPETYHGKILPPASSARMNARFRHSLPLVVSIVVHAALLLPFAEKLEIGKNTPVLTHPVRERVMNIRFAEVDSGQAATQGSAEAPHAPPARQSAPPEEGRIERDNKVYAEYSAVYFTSQELDESPSILTPPDLGVGNISPTLEGEAILRVFLDENGAVDKVDVEMSTLPEMMLQQLQLQRHDLRFSPGKKNGVFVKSVVRYNVMLERDPSITTIFTSSDTWE